ncbi:MAG: hypothetical protein GXX96_38505 [Planctomycetaceae bacterium]|nr:hypothetical protein [Planctomycetaceae bacterium]
MATSDYELVSPPDRDRARELWIQHAAGLILMEDVRRAATESLSPGLTDAELAIAQQGVDAALYSLMSLVDGVTGGLSNGDERVDLTMIVRYSSRLPSGEMQQQYALDLSEGDGMCMGIHGWLESDFGMDPVAKPRSGG